MDFHRVLNAEGAFVADVPWQDDDNGGLPEWFFDGEYIAFEVTLATDTVEWVPAVGPAPVWKGKFSEYATNTAMMTAFKAWAAAVY